MNEGRTALRQTEHIRGPLRILYIINLCLYCALEHHLFIISYNKVFQTGTGLISLRKYGIPLLELPMTPTWLFLRVKSQLRTTVFQLPTVSSATYIKHIGY
jgi:hypothetical protein